jgi:hypothetical protein
LTGSGCVGGGVGVGCAVAAGAFVVGPFFFTCPAAITGNTNTHAAVTNFSSRSRTKMFITEFLKRQKLDEAIREKVCISTLPGSLLSIVQH